MSKAVLPAVEPQYSRHERLVYTILSIAPTFAVVYYVTEHVMHVYLYLQTGFTDGQRSGANQSSRQQLADCLVHASFASASACHSNTTSLTYLREPRTRTCKMGIRSSFSLVFLVY